MDLHLHRVHFLVVYSVAWLLHCALSLAAQCIVIVPVCGGRAVSEPDYSQRAQCLRLSERFFILVRLSVPVQVIDWKDSSLK